MELFIWNILNLLSFVGNTKQYGHSVSTMNIEDHDHSNRQQWYYNATLIYDLKYVAKIDPNYEFTLESILQMQYYREMTWVVIAFTDSSLPMYSSPVSRSLRRCRSAWA